MGAFPYAVRFVDNSFAHSQYLEGIYNTVMVKDIIGRKDTTVGTANKDIGHVQLCGRAEHM